MTIKDIHEYNSDWKAFLQEIWDYVPKGRRKQLVKDKRIKSMLDRFHIEYEE